MNNKLKGIGISSLIEDADRSSYEDIDRNTTPFWNGKTIACKEELESARERAARYIKRAEEKLNASTKEDHLQGIGPIYFCSAEAYEAIEKGDVVPLGFYTNALGHTVIQYAVKGSKE